MLDEDYETKLRPKNYKGKKRPQHRGVNGKMTPVPWVNGGFPFIGEWVRVDSDRAEAAEVRHLCIVCGEHRGDDWVYAAMNGKMVSDTANSMFGIPSPTYGHPECILKAVLFCPHLKKQGYPAMKQDGLTKLSEDDLKQIVREQKKKLTDGLIMGVGTYHTDRRVVITHR